MAFLETVLNIINKKNITKNKMLTDLNLSKNSFVAWSNRGTIPNGETLIKIADYLDCSVDYLLGRTDNPNMESTNYVSGSTITNSPILQSSNFANVIVNDDKNNKKKELSKQALEFAEIFDSLGIRQQAKLLSVLNELEKEL